MEVFKYSLDKSSKKYSCPNCNKKSFVYYVEVETGKYLANDYGRCDREQNCNYHKAPPKGKRGYLIPFLTLKVISNKAHKLIDVNGVISMIPTSAHSGDGMGNLMSILVQLSQNMLAKRLSYSDELQATVLEVKAIPGLGTTIDIVLLNGKLKEGQTMVVAGTEGPIVTTIRSLLTPSKMQDLRVKVSFVY